MFKYLNCDVDHEIQMAKNLMTIWKSRRQHQSSNENIVFDTTKIDLKVRSI